ncbi:MAG: rod shape-determining protein, partial [Bacilli bacterium]|nr:rod shape-determining protein [Bacilli bacterium]
GNMIVDIGYELTKIGVLSLNNVIEYKYIDIGSNTFDNDISDFLRKKYKITISNNQIEKLKQNINNDNINIKGKNIITGLPKSLTIDKDEVLSCLKNSIINIIEEIKNLLGKISPEIFNDISNKGIVITGGGSMLKGLREKIEEELHIPILETVTPQENIIKGIKEVIDNDITQANKI